MVAVPINHKFPMKLLSSFYLTQIASLFLPMMPVGTKYLLGISSLSLIQMAVMNFATF